jgi:hypothetical protein
MGLPVLADQLGKVRIADREGDLGRRVAGQVLGDEVVLGIVGDDHRVVGRRQRANAIEEVVDAAPRRLGGRSWVFGTADR